MLVFAQPGNYGWNPREKANNSPSRFPKRRLGRNLAAENGVATDTAKAVGKLLGAGSPNNNSQPTENENAFSSFVAPISTVGGVPVIQLSTDNEPRQFLIDTGSSICLIQPKVSSIEIRDSAIAPIGITGDRLPLQGEQIIEFRLGSRKFHQKFGVCVLPTFCDGVLGTDFLIANRARIDLMNQRLQVSQTSKGPGSEIGTEVAYTLIPSADGQDGHSVQQEAKTELKREPSAEEKPAPHLADLSDRQE
jgi:hypothetical protein